MHVTDSDANSRLKVSSVHEDIAASRLEQSTVTELVANLTEQYQPIFGHDEFKDTASRATVDRLVQIVAVADDLSAHLGRPLRILDAGCAQGFVALNLASRGHSVLGVDLDENNINLCEGLAIEFGLKSACFSVSDIETVAYDNQRFDLIVLLSVLHHVAYAKGQIQARQVFVNLVDKSLLTIVEFAEQSEPLYWAKIQPTEQEWLADLVFHRVLSRQRTHLGLVRKSLIVSNSHWHFPGDVRVVERAWGTSNKRAPTVHRGTRRFYAASDAFAKVALSGSDNELQRETAFLSSPIDTSTPRVFSSGGNEVESWLVRQHVDGDPLEDIDLESVPTDVRTSWVVSIVRNLAKLEAAGLYHRDVRIWNCFVTEDADIRLIDFGSIGSVAEDVSWPHDLRLSFLLFVDEMYCGVSPDVRIVRRTSPPSLNSWPTDVAKILSEWFLREERFNQFASLLAALENIICGASGERAESSAAASWPGFVDILLNEAFACAHLYDEAVRNRDAAVASLDSKIIKLQEAVRKSDEEREHLEAKLQSFAWGIENAKSSQLVAQSAVKDLAADKDRAFSELSALRRRRSVRVALWLARIFGWVSHFGRHRRGGPCENGRFGSDS